MYVVLGEDENRRTKAESLIGAASCNTRAKTDEGDDICSPARLRLKTPGTPGCFWACKVTLDVARLGVLLGS